MPFQPAPPVQPVEVVLTFGEALAVMMRRAELTDVEVADRLDRNVATVANWRKDATVPREPDLLALCDLVGLDPEVISPGIRNRCRTATRAAS